MLPKEFPYDKFLKLKEEKDKALSSFLKGESWFVPVVQRPSVVAHYGGMCRYRDKSLESQLDFLASYIDLKSDLIYSYLEPWHGVGIYASAFGCPIQWLGEDAPQTLYVYNTAEDLANYRKPDIKNCEIMQMVIETIKYFREQTGDMLEISLTDTQSPNDTASLIMDACEFFMMSISEPEALNPFLNDITDVMIKFTEEQIEAIGKLWTKPGHSMVSSGLLTGISVSDDNMSFLSPQSYINSALPYNNRISRYFGGIAIHSCGNFAHNMDLLMKTEGLTMVDCALGKSVDPSPNDPKELKKHFAGSNVVLKVRLGEDEIDRLEDLIDRKLKLIVEIKSSDDIREKNKAYEKAKQKIDEIVSNL